VDADLQWSSLLQWRWLADIGLVAALIYHMLLLLRGSRSGAMLLAVGLLFGLHYVSREEWLDLPTVHWLLDSFLSSIVVVFVVLFQEDLRRALTSVVRSPLVFSPKDPASSQTIEEVLRACTVLSQRQLGALIVLEQEASLDRFIGDGVRVNAEVSWQLLLAMFIPEHMNATHDGAVIIQKNRIAAAACFLPLAGGAGIPGTLGSRHRAALGLADETDAIVVVVSEETGTCSLAYMGQLDLNLSPADLRERLRLLFGGQPDALQPWQRAWRRRINLHPAAVGRTTGPVPPMPDAPMSTAEPPPPHAEDAP
jgi:diadenylate cyclase